MRHCLKMKISFLDYCWINLGISLSILSSNSSSNCHQCQPDNLHLFHANPSLPHSIPHLRQISVVVFIISFFSVDVYIIPHYLKQLTFDMLINLNFLNLFLQNDNNLQLFSSLAIRLIHQHRRCNRCIQRFKLSSHRNSDVIRGTVSRFLRQAIAFIADEKS